MRVVAFALVALSLGAMTPGPAAAQPRGPDYDDDRSGPPAYYTGRPPRPDQDIDRPPVRGIPNDRGAGYDPTSDPRPRARPQPWPADYGPGERRPAPSYRRAGPAPAPDSYQRFWDDRDDRRSRTVTKSAPREIPPPREPRHEAAPLGPREAPPASRPAQDHGGPVSRVAVGADQMVISISEYQSLQDQARQLQRLLGTRRDFHDDRSSRDFREDGPRRDSGPREIYR